MYKRQTGGAAALAGAMLLGARTGRFDKSGAAKPMRPFAASSIPLVTVGVFILWLGWFGFNGGSQLAMGTFDDAVAVSNIFINTNLAACGGVLAAAVMTRLLAGKTDVVQMLNGAIGGLVAITAEPLAPAPIAAIFIGAIGGIIVVQLKQKTSILYYRTLKKLTVKLLVSQKIVWKVTKNLEINSKLSLIW